MARTSGQTTFEGSISDYLIKCRSTVEIFKAAEEQGVLKAGMEIIEPAFDCAGVIMAYVAADRGYNLTLTIPETMSYGRRKILAALGANVILTSAIEGQKGAIKRAEEIASAEPQKCFLSHRFNNQDSSKIQTATPANVIRNDSCGIINVSVSGVSSCSTVPRVSRYTQRIRGRQFYSAMSTFPVLT
ncbi:MAG: pyridoxal-phosphate dependent enzyme [Desulfuromonadaceae bacterium]